MIPRHLRAIRSWVGRRRDGVGPTDTAIACAGGSTGFALAMLAVTVVEIAVIELLVPWPGVRWALLGLSVLALVPLLGTVAATVVRPHVLDADTLRIRQGHAVDVRLELREIARVSVHRRNAEHPHGIDATTATVASDSQTQLDVVLHHPRMMQVGRDRAEVSTLRISADDPAAARRALVEAIGAARRLLRGEVVEPLPGPQPGQARRQPVQDVDR